MRAFTRDEIVQIVQELVRKADKQYTDQLHNITGNPSHTAAETCLVQGRRQGALGMANEIGNELKKWEDTDDD